MVGQRLLPRGHITDALQIEDVVGDVAQLDGVGWYRTRRRWSVLGPEDACHDVDAGLGDVALPVEAGAAGGEVGVAPGSGEARFVAGTQDC